MVGFLIFYSIMIAILPSSIAAATIAPIQEGFYTGIDSFSDTGFAYSTDQLESRRIMFQLPYPYNGGTDDGGAGISDDATNPTDDGKYDDGYSINKSYHSYFDMVLAFIRKILQVGRNPLSFAVNYLPTATPTAAPTPSVGAKWNFAVFSFVKLLYVFY